MFFTLSMMLLGSALLSFIFFLSEQSTKSSDTVTYLIEVDMASDKYSEAEDGLARILSQSINISVQNNTVRINETLPISPDIADDLGRFSQFEANYSAMNVSMNLTNITRGQFIIQPSGTIVANSAGRFEVTPQNTAAGAGTLTAYEVELVFLPGVIDDAAWLAVSNSSGTTMNVHVRVRDASYAVVKDFYQALDKYGSSAINVTKTGATVAMVGFSSPAALSVQCDGNIGLKASISFSNQAYVETDDTISVWSSANRTGRARIA
jgi:hypothetical protein